MNIYYALEISTLLGWQIVEIAYLDAELVKRS
jgi:hypothetical protein